jgi:hypothetical protein
VPPAPPPLAQEQQKGGGDAAVQVLIAGSGAPPSQPGVVLVTGATGGVGKRGVQQLLAGGRHVRALVRDVSKARELLVGGVRARPGAGCLPAWLPACLPAWALGGGWAAWRPRRGCVHAA